MRVKALTEIDLDLPDDTPAWADAADSAIQQAFERGDPGCDLNVEVWTREVRLFPEPESEPEPE